MEGDPRSDTCAAAAHMVGVLWASASQGATVKELRAAVGMQRERLEAAYEYLLEHPPLGLQVQRHGDEFLLVSAPEVAASIERHLGNPRPLALSSAALEVLAIIAYKQPIARSGIERVRGSNSHSALEAIAAGRVPMLVRAGWLDAATVDGALSRYLTSDMPQELFIGAWSHGGEDDVDPFQPRWTFPNPTFGQQFADLVAFFDRYLAEPATSVPVNSIRYYTMNEGQWRTTPTWPPPEMGARRWYVGTDQSLTDSPARGEDDYVVDFSASSGDTTRWHTNLTGRDVYYPDRAGEDASLLTYTGTPLEGALRITGTPVVSLHLSSTHADGALHVYLEDVAPDGRVTYLTEGILRLIHGVSDDAVLPYEQPRPPRSFRRADAEPLTPGEVVRVELPLYATSVRLEAGHRLRIAIAGHDASTFARYPEDGAPVLTVVYSAGCPSFLELPVATD